MRKLLEGKTKWRNVLHKRKQPFFKKLIRKWDKWKGKYIFLNTLKAVANFLQIIAYTVVVVKLVQGEGTRKNAEEKRQSD